MRSPNGGIVLEPTADESQDAGERESTRKSDTAMFQAFMAHARRRGFFEGCERGSAEYNLKVQQCIAKFEELKAKNL